MQQQPNIDHIFVCVGGGGLISGLAIGAKSIKPDVNIIGKIRKQHAAADLGQSSADRAEILDLISDLSSN